ncbi:MAG: hypothetical protein L0Y58_19235 [Verrucomicrobia subdivision 3 bacterium]|nr:hypothetical protein [Limisphaerales bacterium]
MNGPELLEPVLDFLDTLIAEHGHILYMVLVYVSLPLIAWILSGGLRRRLSHRENAAAPPMIVIWRTSTPPPLPPDIVGDYRPQADDDEQSFDA